MSDPVPPTTAPPRPTFEEAFPDGDSIEMRPSIGVRFAFVGIAAAGVGAQFVLLDFPDAPAWFHAIHLIAGLAYAFAAALMLMREDRLSPGDVGTRSLLGSQQVAWDDVAEAVQFDPTAKGETWQIWIGLLLASMFGVVNDWIYDKDLIPSLVHMPIRSHIVLWLTLWMGTTILILAVGIALTRGRGRMGFGRCLVLRDHDGRTVFSLRSWPCLGADRTFDRVLRYLEIPITRVGAGHRL